MKTYPKVFCEKHRDILLVDVDDGAGGIEAVCPRCVPVELVDVVRQIFKRTGSK